MDIIRVGLDFGTHQTKICVQTTPDEGHGQPIYEFFTFKDLDGKEQYFLPSLIQVNKDDTISYGFVDSSKEKNAQTKPVFKNNSIGKVNFDIEKTASILYNKYATNNNSTSDILVIEEMLKIRKEKLEEQEKNRYTTEQKKYESLLDEYQKKREVYRYFKQATFAVREWNKKIDSNTLSIWYLSYVIFLLEEKYGTNFSINMGIPADDKSFTKKKELAVEILLSAYNLVENVYKNDIKSFLSESPESLLKKTEYKHYSKEAKDEYYINIFPEAYAGLVTLTSRGKLSNGMSLTADIGGGTTDISFFTIQENHPVIYRYWSIPRGLNYIAEKSGFDFFEGNISEQANKEIIYKYNRKKMEIVSILINDLVKQISCTCIPVKNLYNALKDRIIVYTGGGSTLSFLTTSVCDFTDVKIVNSSMWKEENVKDKTRLSDLCQLLTTAYGLSICENDEEVKLCPFSTIFFSFNKQNKEDHSMIEKEQC